jgi:hypothetical protein
MAIRSAKSRATTSESSPGKRNGPRRTGA